VADAAIKLIQAPIMSPPTRENSDPDIIIMGMAEPPGLPLRPRQYPWPEHRRDRTEEP
jgi:hypothetical protein